MARPTKKIVNYKEAKDNIDNWIKQGIRVKQHTVRGRGHLLTAIYYIKNTAKVVAEAKRHHKATSP